jgi:hypothetical protein
MTSVGIPGMCGRDARTTMATFFVVNASRLHEAGR